MSNDNIMSILRGKGFSGSYNDVVYAWASSELGTGGHINDLLSGVAKRTGASNINDLLNRFDDLVGERWYYKADGVNDYISIPTASLTAGDTVQFSFIADSISEIANRFWLDALDATIRISVNSSGEWNEFGPSKIKAFIDSDTELVRGVTSLTPYADGKVHTITLEVIDSGSLDFVHSSRAPGQISSTILFNLEINSSSGNRFYPINDSWSSNPVILDTEGGINGTAMNFNEGNWSEF